MEGPGAEAYTTMMVFGSVSFYFFCTNTQWIGGVCGFFSLCIRPVKKAKSPVTGFRPATVRLNTVGPVALHIVYLVFHTII